MSALAIGIPSGAIVIVVVVGVGQIQLAGACERDERVVVVPHAMKPVGAASASTDMV